jgi:hypothetical protein
MRFFIYKTSGEDISQDEVPGYSLETAKDESQYIEVSTLDGLLGLTKHMSFGYDIIIKSENDLGTHVHEIEIYDTYRE